MTTQPVIKPEWLEMIECCSAKVQMDLIRAIVAWQTEGVIPEFRGTKKAIFLIMVRDIDPEAATLIAAATDKPSKTKKDKNATGSRLCQRQCRIDDRNGCTPTSTRRTAARTDAEPRARVRSVPQA